MTNLWNETIQKLSAYGKTFEDVCYIQGKDFQITKENFKQIAKKSNYNSGFGTARVAMDLVLVGKGWWLERYDYDGAEEWEFKETPKQLNETKEVKHLAEGVWSTLAAINDFEVEEVEQ